MKPKTSLIKETILPELTKNSVKVEAFYSAISPGTERLVYQGLVPESLRSSMKVPYMEGDFTFPVKYGYSLVGQIIEGPDELISRKIHVMHPHQELAVVNQNDVLLLPNDISDERASLISNVETCVNAIWDSNLKIGDRVVVVGFGTIGSLLAMILQEMNLIEVFVSDINPTKLQLAKNLGFQILERSEGHIDSFDIAFHTSSTGSGLNTSIDLVGKEGKVIELSWYGSKSINLNLGTSFHIQRKKIISSQVSTISPKNQARWDYKRRKLFVLSILKNKKFEGLITKIVNFDEIANSFDELCRIDSPNLSLLVKYR